MYLCTFLKYIEVYYGLLRLECQNIYYRIINYMKLQAGGLNP